MHYRNRTKIEAFNLISSAPRPRWFLDAMDVGAVILNVNGSALIMRADGSLHADQDDWIARDAQGRLFPIKADDFEKTYYEVEGEIAAF